MHVYVQSSGLSGSGYLLINILSFLCFCLLLSLFLTCLGTFVSFVAFDLPMDKINPPKNFLLSQENMKVALDAFRVGMSVANTMREIAHAISPRAAGRIVPSAPASSRSQVPAPKDSHYGVPKAPSRSWTPNFSRSPVPSKSKSVSLPASQELIVIKESAEDSSKAVVELTPAVKGAPKRKAEVVS